MSIDKLHGFGFRDDKVAVSASKCTSIFADTRFTHIINRIAEKHSDIFIWQYVVDMVETHPQNKMSVGLFYADTRSERSGIELEFGTWDRGKTADVTVIACHKHDMDAPDSGNYFRTWDLDKVDENIIASDILTLIETYLTEDFNKIFDVKVKVGE